MDQALDAVHSKPLSEWKNGLSAGGELRPLGGDPAGGSLLDRCYHRSSGRLRAPSWVNPNRKIRISAPGPYLLAMLFEFCLPTRAQIVLAAPEWFHEIKFDGYRLRLERNGKRVRLITKGGYDWTKRFPWIVEAALKNRQSHFAIDGEAVILGVDGRSDFNALHSNRRNAEVQLCAFDVMALGGEDLRALPLSTRKTNLERLLRGRPDGIFVSPFESGAIGPDLFRAACNHGLEGLVSKRSDRPYRGGKSKDWIKVKNRQHHAFTRVREAFS
jgi:ATP-dependent DNA ligase